MNNRPARLMPSRHLRRRGWLAAMLALTLTLPASAVAQTTAADACPDRFQAWLVKRTGTKPRTLRGMIDLHPTSDRALVVTIGFRQRGHTRNFYDATYSSYVLDATHSPWPRAYSTAGTPVSPVESPGAPIGALCGQPMPPGQPYYPYSLPMLDAPEPTDLSYYVLAYDEDIRIRLSPGWTAKKVPGGGVRAALGNDTGAQARHIAVDDFSGPVSLAGGSAGSFAFAALPCERYVTPDAPGGTGTGHLAGGDEGDGGPQATSDQSRNMTCDALNRSTSIAAAHGRTRWTLTGQATGTSTEWFRLLVIDFPRP